MGNRPGFSHLWYSRPIEAYPATGSPGSPILWRIELFAELRGHREGQTIERIPTQKTAALLAFLAFYPRQRHPRERLTDLLWPDAHPTAARDRLSQALVWLRRQLEPEGIPRGTVLLADRLTVQFAPDRLSTDVAEFEAALATARTAGARRERRAALQRAVEAYRGELLPRHYSDWVLTERRRLLEEYLTALQALAGLYEEDGERGQALLYARLAVAADPLREEAHNELIRLLMADGQEAAARRQYREMEERLARELGVAPSPKSAPPRAVMPPSPPSRPILPSLPVPLTRFFGRDSEILRVREIIQTRGARLVTLIGIGGSGKTRLSLAVAAELANLYKGSVAFVPLADLDDARTIPAALATALQLPGPTAGSAWDAVVEILAARPFLLVLDNLEHLREDAAPLIRELLERAPPLTLLATSRQRLGLEGECEVAVASLPLPPPEASPAEIHTFASVQLFIDRARAVRPEFALTDDNATVVAAVCQRLEGIPLAIELCAAWAATLTPEQMLEHLNRRFDLLVSRRTDIPPRHRTLRAALEYSYLQLPTDLQGLFARLSVFRGGWTLDAAGAVGREAGEVDDLHTLSALTELRERSLILAEEVRTGGTGDTGATMRYSMLETLREFAGEQLNYAERAARRHAHAAYFLHLAEQEKTGTANIEEQENLRTALAWSLDTGEIEIGLRLGVALERYWARRGPLSEGQEWLRRLLERFEQERAAGKQLPQPPPVGLLARAWSAAGYLAWARGDYAVAVLSHERALALRREAEDQAGIAESLYHLGITLYRQGDFTAAQGFLEESLSLARQRADRAGIARVLLNLGNVAYEQQRYEDARSLFQQSLDLERELGNHQRTAHALNNLGLVMLETRNFPRATTLLEETLALYRAINDHYGTAVAFANLGKVARLAGENRRARSLLNQGVRLASEMGNRHILVHQFLQAGILDTAEGNPGRGALLLSGSYHLLKAIGGGEGMPTIKEYETTRATLRRALGEAEFEAAWARGAALPLGQLVAEALAAPAPEGSASEDAENNQGVGENSE